MYTLYIIDACTVMASATMCALSVFLPFFYSATMERGTKFVGVRLQEEEAERCTWGPGFSVYLRTIFRGWFGLMNLF